MTKETESFTCKPSCVTIFRSDSPAMSSHIYIYSQMDRQGLEEAVQSTSSLLQFKLAAQSWLFEHASHRVSGRHYVTHYARLERENCSHPERAYDYSALYGETSHIKGDMDPRSIA